MTARVVVYTAAGCGLCARALEVVREAQAELRFELDVVDVGGDPVLERSLRERLPVVEIDGEPAFTYFVDPDALRARLADRAGARSPPGDGSRAGDGRPLAES